MFMFSWAEIVSILWETHFVIESKLKWSNIWYIVDSDLLLVAKDVCFTLLDNGQCITCWFESVYVLGKAKIDTSR